MGSKGIAESLDSTATISREDPYLDEEHKRKLAARTDDKAPGLWQDQLQGLCAQKGIRWSQLTVPKKQESRARVDAVATQADVGLHYVGKT